MLENFGYWPQPKGGTNRKRFRFGDYAAFVRSDFDPIDDEDDEIEYLFVMAVFKLPERQLCLAVASEMSAEVKALWERHPELNPGREQAFLGVFSGEGHSNLGSSSDWTDLDKFTTSALDLAREQLNVRAEATEQPV